ncbi:hypothetical protein [Methanosarcina acetivorans]|uniref:hypothetical protein n=1 Tax=Methanosarcina acetivorans TaxID=2214 RepID=UPI000A777538|nr:hypothetical protein [Methanosarcina acetivorans]
MAGCSRPFAAAGGSGNGTLTCLTGMERLFFHFSRTEPLALAEDSLYPVFRYFLIFQSA